MRRRFALLPGHEGENLLRRNRWLIALEDLRVSLIVDRDVGKIALGYQDRSSVSAIGGAPATANGLVIRLPRPRAQERSAGL